MKTTQPFSLLNQLSRYILLFFIVMLTACGGGGGGGGGGGTDGGSGGGGVSSGGNEGSVDSTTGLITPAVATVSYSGTVLTGTSYYVVQGLTASAKYDVYVHSATDDIALYTSASSFFSTWCSSNRAGTLSEACGATADSSGDLYFKVSGAGTASGATYTVKIIPAAVTEGTASAPVNVTASLPYQGSVANSGTSYYVVDGLTPGQNYNVSLTSMVYKASLNTYPHNTFLNPSTAAAAACFIDNPNWEDETCVQAANFEGKLYIKVSDLYTGASKNGSHYRLNVTAGSGTAGYFEGYWTAPKVLSSTPYTGIAYGYSSFYKITGLTAGLRYEVHFDNASSDSTLINVEQRTDTGDGSSCTRYSSSLPGFHKWCVATATDSGNLYVRVDGANDAVTTFDLDVKLAPVSEGTEVAPKAISMPYAGQVDNSMSYYMVSGLTPNWNYELLISDETRPVALYTGTSIATAYNSSTGKTNASGELFIKVSGFYSTMDDGSWFTLNIGPANNPEGSIAAPVDASAATEGTPHAGQVDDSVSYYTVNGLAPGQYYMTHLNGIVVGGGSIDIFSDSTFAFSSKVCTSSGSAGVDQEAHCLAPANASGELYIEITGGWDITGSTYNVWTVPSQLSHEGTAVVPLDITGAINTGVAVTHSGQVTTYKVTPSYYKLVLDSGPANYTVSLSNMTGNVDLQVWNAVTGWTDSCLSKRNHLLDESCVITSEVVAGGVKTVDLYVRVDVVDYYDDHWDGATFDLTVTPGGTLPVVEGTSVAPVDITASLPYAGKTAGSSLNYYVVTGLDPNSRYEISSTNDIFGMDTNVYSDALSSASPVLLCTARNVAPIHGFSKRLACQASPNVAGELYITVASDGSVISSDNFSLSVHPAPVAEGDMGVPIEIVGVGTRASQVNGLLDGSGNYTVDTVNSYYHVTGLQAGSTYMAQVNNDTEKVNLFVYEQAGFVTLLCNTDTWISQCPFIANSAGEAYIHADGYGYFTNSGSFFDLTIAPMPVAEGTASSPIVVTPGVVYRGQQGGYLNNSYYKVTGLIPYSTHRFLISNLTGDTGINLYAQAAMIYKTCDTFIDDVVDGCSVAANADGEIFFKAVNNRTTGATFDVFVTP